MDRTKGRERVKNGLFFRPEEREGRHSCQTSLVSLRPTIEDRSRLGNTKHRREFQGVEGRGWGSFNIASLSFCILRPIYGGMLLHSFLRYAFPQTGRGCSDSRTGIVC
jgi:hypothetical protein